MIAVMTGTVSISIKDKQRWCQRAREYGTGDCDGNSEHRRDGEART